jgi:hypothetical protein
LFFAAIILAAPTLFASHTPSAVKPFHHVPRASIPLSLGRFFCVYGDRELESDCLKSFRTSAETWEAVVSDRGVVAWAIFPGSYFSGSGGRSFTLLRRRGGGWVRLLNLCWAAANDDCEDEWQTVRPRVDLLPIVRSGYHDLRIEVDHCVKWDGKSYVNYTPEDYHQLLPTWFDASNPNEAEIFWTIRYAGSDHIQFTPQWFPIPSGEIVRKEEWERAEKAGLPILFPSNWRPLGEMPHWPYTVLDDPVYNIRWVGLVRGGTWGVRGEQGFLLHPRCAYLGSRELQVSDDWLYVYEGIGEEAKPEDALVRHNRRTLQLDLLGGNQGSGP